MNSLPNLQVIESDFIWQLKTKYSNKLSGKWYPEIRATIFEQMWGSTTLGFGGIGGQAITGAWTTVIWDEITYIWGVYFGNRLAYTIENPNDIFKNDVFHGRGVEPVSRRGKYLKKDE